MIPRNEKTHYNLSPLCFSRTTDGESYYRKGIGGGRLPTELRDYIYCNFKQNLTF